MFSKGRQLLDPVVPQLDYSAFTSKDEEHRKRFSQDFVESLSNLGFVTLVNHPFDDDYIAQLFSWNQRFFALSHADKMTAAHPAEANPHRGYSYVGQEQLTDVQEIKETFDQGSPQDPLYSNRWPPEYAIPGLRLFMEDFFDRCHSVHIALLGAIELGTDVPPGYLSTRCLKNSSELRLNHYPACPSSQIRMHGAKRIAEHADFGALTLLFQDAVGGLEAERKDMPGCFFPVPVSNYTDIDRPAQNVMVVNAGLCMQRWTNDQILAARHHVVLPPNIQDSDWIVEERFSVAYFGKPDREENVGSLELFCTREGEEARYGTATAWEFNQSRLQGTY